MEEKAEARGKDLESRKKGTNRIGWGSKPSKEDDENKKRWKSGG